MEEDDFIDDEDIFEDDYYRYPYDNSDEYDDEEELEDEE